MAGVTGMREYYEEGYSLTGDEGAKMGRWRALGARSKGAHVAELCARAELRPATLVEIGCGDGAVLAELAARGVSPVLDGFELSPTAAEIARGRGVARRVEAFDGVHIPVEDDAYDLAVLSHVVEHVPDPVPLLKEAARIAPYVLVEVPLEDNRSAERPAKRKLAEAAGHLHAYNRASLKAQLTRAGLDTTRTSWPTRSSYEHHAFFSTPAKAAVKHAIRATDAPARPARGGAALHRPLRGAGYARVKRRPSVGEASSSSRRTSSIMSASARCFSASSLASRSGVSSPAFSSSIRWSHSAPAACSASSTSICLVVRVLVDLHEQLVDEPLLRHLLERLAAGEDQALVLGAGDAEVGVRGLADAVDRAAEHGDLDRVLVGLQPALDVGHHGVHVELQAAAGRDTRSAPGRFSRSFSALRISQATLTSSSAWNVEREMRIVSPIPSASSVPRPTADFSEPDHFVPASVMPRCSGYGIRSLSSRFAAIVFGTFVDLIETLKSSKSQALHQRDELDRGGHERLDGVLALERVQVLGQRSRVHADAHRRARGPRAVGDLGDLLRAADVARVEPDAVRAGVDRLQRQRVVEVDVGDDRDRRLDARSS